MDIVRRAVEEPLRQLARNAGAEGSIIVEKVRGGKPGFGYNVLTGEFVDMFKAGIVDPCKVTRSALQHAASVGSMMLTTEVADRATSPRKRRRCPQAARSRR